MSFYHLQISGVRGRNILVQDFVPLALRGVRASVHHRVLLYYCIAACRSMLCATFCSSRDSGSEAIFSGDYLWVSTSCSQATLLFLSVVSTPFYQLLWTSLENTADHPAPADLQSGLSQLRTSWMPAAAQICRENFLSVFFFFLMSFSCMNTIFYVSAQLFPCSFGDRV